MHHRQKESYLGFAKKLILPLVLLLTLATACQAEQEQLTPIPPTPEAIVEDYEFEYELIEASQELENGLEYSSEQWGISFVIDDESFNIFKPKGDHFFNGLLVFPSNDWKDLANVAYGDGFMFVTSLAVGENEENETLEGITKNFHEYENVVESSSLEIDNIPAEKIIITTFGSKEITFYLAVTEEKIYAFKASEDESEMLERIVMSMKLEK